MPTPLPTHHHMRLHPGPIEDIRSGIKKSELRLNDEKRQLVKVGDTITFTSLSDSSQISVRVDYLKSYPDFKALYHGVLEDYPRWKEDSFIEGMYPYYTPADEQKYGALEIGITLLPISRVQLPF